MASQKTVESEIREYQYGVWKFKVADYSATSKSPRQRWNDFISSLPLLWRLVSDVFNVAPVLLVLYVLSEIWGGIDSTLMIHFANQILQTIEVGLATGRFDGVKISKAVLSRTLCVLLVPHLYSLRRRVSDLLESRIMHHFELMILQAELKMDMKTSEKTKGIQGATPMKAWTAVKEMLAFARYITQAFSQSLLIVQISRTSGGPLFALSCMLCSLVSLFTKRSFFSYVSLFFAHNIHYRRMIALQKFSDKDFRQDVISGNLGSWILSETKKTHDSLSHIPSTEKHPVHVFSEAQETTFAARAWEAFVLLSRDMPLMYYAFSAWKNPAATSIAGIAILQQSTSSLEMTMRIFVRCMTRFQETVDSFKSVYVLVDIPSSTRPSGQVPYPYHSVHGSADFDVNKGMAVELRDVSFSYSGEQTKEPALKNISLKIPSGNLVVVVGANGSGKSTLIRVITRLYDPTDGELLIDGRPATDYNSNHLQEATAVLSQDNKLYPFTLAENIGLGCPELVEDEEAILDAARKGGAVNVIRNLKDGLHTQLDPSIGLRHHNLIDKPHHPLYPEMERLQKKLDVSGGEKQKIVASRMFMRFNSGKVKLVAVDEPSSALDAEAELDLFNNLIAAREGKTLLMVTHRFGHLTKHADMIICMKGGQIVESGTHVELMAAQGEYANLYSIQAQAFAE
ncbi:P-loop containing nucleoside triphosphate hydrolase protein [Agrocybe pediades]|nr:P-loop containing nucleoside triphosphate hydrolase protein [Agrocybe pediades]